MLEMGLELLAMGLGEVMRLRAGQETEPLLNDSLAGAGSGWFRGAPGISRVQHQPVWGHFSLLLCLLGAWELHRSQVPGYLFCKESWRPPMAPVTLKVKALDCMVEAEVLLGVGSKGSVLKTCEALLSLRPLSP